MNYNNAKQLAEIIVKIKLNQASEKEREMLLDWLDESEANRQTYKNIISGESLLKRLKIEEKILETVDMNAICMVIARKLMRRESNRRISLSASIAVGCILLFISGWVFFSEKNSSDNILLGNHNSKVKLVMESGNVINLDKGVPDSIDASSAIIVRDAGGLTYRQKDKSTAVGQAEIKNKIITEAGGEYTFTLSDGTKVWLNSLSEIEFPVSFKGDKRVVNLKGEAYFEVKHDSDRPFIVHSLNQSIQVLGTCFNIKAYENEQKIYTTLIEGKVSVGSGGNNVVLSPGMESVCERENNEIETHTVNPYFSIAWRTGYFMFNNEDLDMILRVLSRWYGVEFVYDKPASGPNTFSGRFSKYGDIETTLKSINLAGGPSFTIDKENKTIHIKQ